MSQHNAIYATFLSEHDAERAAGALMDHGVRPAFVSFILPCGPQTPPVGTTTPSMPHATLVTPVSPPAYMPIPRVETPAPIPSGAIDLTTGAPITEAVPDLNTLNTVAVNTVSGHGYDAFGAEALEASASVAVAYAPPVDREYLFPINRPLYSALEDAQNGSSTIIIDMPAIAADAPRAVVEADHVHILDIHRTEPHASGGITTTTGRDAAKGAFEGAGLGIGLGALLGLAVVAIPGVGLVAGTGVLVAGLAAATGAAGAVAGGTYGFLHDLGLPSHYTQHLQTHLESGQPVLSVHLNQGVLETEIIQLLEKYGATSAQAF